MCTLEFLLLILSVMVYFWIFIPLFKRKIGYRRPKQTTVFYDYKTSWQFWYEAGVIVATILLTTLLTPIFKNLTVLFVPLAFVAILGMRGKLERDYHPEEKYHIISYTHAIAVIVAFGAVGLYALFV